MIEQTNATADVSEAGAFYRNQSHFQVELKAGILPSAPARELSYFEWHITTDPMEINGGREDCSELLPLLDSLTVRGKLLKIKRSDKHKTSQEC